MAETRERIRTARRLQEVARYRAELIVPRFKLIQGLKHAVNEDCTPERVTQSGLRLVGPKDVEAAANLPRKGPMRVETRGWRGAVRVVNAGAGMWHWLSL